MSTVAEPRTKRIFIASSWADVAPIRQAMDGLPIESSTIEEDATPGTTWVDSIYRCIEEADVVLGVMGDRRQDTGIFFELGVASALNKPTLLLVDPNYPPELIPPSGLLQLRINLRDQEALRFGLQQALALVPRGRPNRSEVGFASQPIGGMIAEWLLESLDKPDLNESGFADLIQEAIECSRARMVTRESASGITLAVDGRQSRVDLVVWANDLEPTFGNPLLIECQMTLATFQEVDAILGRMLQALKGIRNGCGLVLYRKLGPNLSPLPVGFPVIFMSAPDFIKGLSSAGLSEFLRKHRNAISAGI